MLTLPRFKSCLRLVAASKNNPALKKGEMGIGVALIQQALAELLGDHYLPQSLGTGSPNGIFNEETFQAVKEFQEIYGFAETNEYGKKVRDKLAIDGIVGKQTLAVLEENLSPMAAQIVEQDHWPADSAAPATGSVPTKQNGQDPFLPPSWYRSGRWLGFGAKVSAQDSSQLYQVAKERYQREEKQLIHRLQFKSGNAVDGPMEFFNGLDFARVALVSFELDICFTMFIASLRKGIGLGLSGGPVGVLISGLRDPRQLNRCLMDGSDWNLAVGQRWGAAIKSAVTAAQISKASKLGAIGEDLLKHGPTLANYHKIMTGIAQGTTNAYFKSQLQVSVIDSPIGGYGYEASIFEAETFFFVDRVYRRTRDPDMHHDPLLNENEPNYAGYQHIPY